MDDVGNIYKHIFNNMKDGICIVDTTGDVVYMNDATRRILGVEQDNNSDCKLVDIIPGYEENDEFLQLLIDSIFNKGETRESIINFKRDDGHSLHLRVNISYMVNPDGIIILFTDLTELFLTNNAFVRYTSAEIADIVLNTPDGSNLGGKIKEVTILMSDLRGYTSVSTRTPAEDLISMVNHYFEVMSDIIIKYRGTVIEFLGDGIFSVFGAPKDDPYHASDAVACALEMQLAMESVNSWNIENGFPKMEMGIGINTGIVVVGNIGSENRMKYGCLGEQVNIAGRIETLATGGQVIITENTKNRIRSKLRILSTDQLKLKGSEKEINIYHISGIGGKYRLFLEKEEYDLNPVKAPCRIKFSIVENKTVEPKKYKADITHLSDRYALMTTDCPLAASANILLDIGGDLYAKAVESSEDGFVIRFTSTPEIFDDWIGKYLQ